MHATMSGDRVFTIAFSVSLGIHLIMLIGQLLSLDWLLVLKPTGPLEVVYDANLAESETRLLRDQLLRAKRDAISAPAPGHVGERMQVRIPDQPFLAGERPLAESMPARASIVDLTDLVDASRGDPVLLSYFSAIREQIQRTADHEMWSVMEDRGGLVYISFVLGASGAVQEAAIVSGRSASARSLQEIALRIVREAAPFPPFPPSMDEPSKTIVVPLEFLAGP